MVDKNTALKDHNQVLSKKHRHTNNLDTWTDARIEAYSSQVPDLGWKEGVWVKCSCGSEAWLRLVDVRRK